MLQCRRLLCQTAPREYFFYLNDHGHLYHLMNPESFEKGKIPVGPAHLRNDKFLDFFFTMMKENKTGMHPSYKWVSRCKGELNFLWPSDTPVVFHGVKNISGTDQLWYGAENSGRLTVPFQPDQLSICDEGRLYHPSPIGNRALLSCHCALRLGLDDIWDLPQHVTPTLKWNGGEYPLKKVPSNKDLKL
eukprot:TRINITY_DN15630_c0_g1_i1.p1 TRINITY_DN15630_c0_g1~~TRINITY_DN15630_c0_g1_i1.p1  ORF type:complete len:189 (+),score=24.78 TRINITY_DN15630_c0_g1_i1:75-641(+)